LKRNDRVELGTPASCGQRLKGECPSLKQICAASLCPQDVGVPIFSLRPQDAGAPSQFAAACGIPIKYETLPLAFGRVIYLAEASLQPPQITVNTTAIAALVKAAAQMPTAQQDWFTERAITEVIIAHELYHILAQEPSSQAAELQAHEFARRFTGLPFSPCVFEAILKQTVECPITKNIT
jgi:hypothetical protein